MAPSDMHEDDGFAMVGGKSRLRSRSRVVVRGQGVLHAHHACDFHSTESAVVGVHEVHALGRLRSHYVSMVQAVPLVWFRRHTRGSDQGLTS